METLCCGNWQILHLCRRVVCCEFLFWCHEYDVVIHFPPVETPKTRDDQSRRRPSPPHLTVRNENSIWDISAVLQIFDEIIEGGRRGCLLIRDGRPVISPRESPSRSIQTVSRRLKTPIKLFFGGLEGVFICPLPIRIEISRFVFIVEEDVTAVP